MSHEPTFGDVLGVTNSAVVLCSELRAVGESGPWGGGGLSSERTGSSSWTWSLSPGVGGGTGGVCDELSICVPNNLLKPSAFAASSLIL